MQTLSRRQFSSALGAGLGFLARPARAAEPAQAPGPGTATAPTTAPAPTTSHRPRLQREPLRSFAPRPRRHDPLAGMRRTLSRREGAGSDGGARAPAQGGARAGRARLRLGRDPEDGATRPSSAPGERWWRRSRPSRRFWSTRRLTRAEGVKVPLTAGPPPRPAAMAAACDARTGLVYVCNPNNPTGTIVSGDELQAFLHKAPKTAMVAGGRGLPPLRRGPALSAAPRSFCPLHENLVRGADVLEDLRPGGDAPRLRGRLGKRRPRPMRAQQVWSNANSARARGRRSPASPSRSTWRRRGWPERHEALAGRRARTRRAGATMPSETNFVMIDVGRDVEPLPEPSRQGHQGGPPLPRPAAVAAHLDRHRRGDARLPRRPARDRARPAGLKRLKRLVALAAAGLGARGLRGVGLGGPALPPRRPCAGRPGPGQDRAHAAAGSGRPGEEATPPHGPDRSAAYPGLALPHPGRDQLGGPEVLRPRGHRLEGDPRVGGDERKKGRAARGGSTITQQLAKNLYLRHGEEPRLRKVREAIVTRLAGKRPLEGPHPRPST